MVAPWQGLALEILDLVMTRTFSEERDAARAARVCKNWKGVALDHAWHDANIDGLMFLFEILAPTSVVPEQTPPAGDYPVPVVLKEFSRPISHSDWDRLLLYARRIKVLNASLAPSEESSYVLSRASLADLFLTKPNNIPLLPRLRDLVVGGQLDTRLFPWISFFTHLLHDNLRTIDIDAPQESVEMWTCFVEEISRRAKNIELLEITISGEPLGASHTDRISKCVSSMHKMKDLSISSSLLSPLSFTSFQKCKDLQSIRIYSDFMHVHPIPPFGRLPNSTAPGAFPSLTYLTVQCTLAEWNRMLANAP